MSDDPASAEAFRWELEQTIERLKKTRDALTEERDELVRISNKLIRERDEARRGVMHWMSERSSTSEMTAEYKKRGWEYLKDNP